MLTTDGRVGARAAEAVLQSVRSRFLHPSRGGGVVLRVWECSLSCVKLEDSPPLGTACNKTCGSRITNCLAIELDRGERVGSLLRSDVPAALYMDGLCAADHDVHEAAVGWVYAELDGPLYDVRKGAFPHDAGVWRQHGAKWHRLQPCAAKAKSYAEERHRSDAEAFRNSSWNCYRQPHAWDQAVADQRAFASLAAKADRGGGPALRTSGDPPRCPTDSSGLYNQVHTGNADNGTLPFVAIFYVNSTLRAGSAEPTRARALAVAAEAHRHAREAQKALVEWKGLALPLLQFRVPGECDDAAAWARRDAQLAADATSMATMFALPPYHFGERESR